MVMVLPKIYFGQVCHETLDDSHQKVDGAGLF